MLNRMLLTVVKALGNKYKSDCSGFAKAVAEDFGIVLTGQANDIVDQIQKQPWQLLKSGSEASNKAAGLVVAGLKGAPLGHVIQLGRFRIF